MAVDPSDIAEPRHERLKPDPVEPPDVAAPWPLVPEAGDPPRDFIPERFLQHPALEIDVWRQVWERDLSFPVSSHRGLAGKLIVAFKRLLRPFVRLALADLYERERVYQLALLRFVADEHALLVSLRHNYDFLRLRTVADLLSRGDAIFGILDRRIDALEALVAERAKESQGRAGRLEARLAALPGAPDRQPEAAVRPQGPALPPAAPVAPAAPAAASPQPAWLEALFAGQAYADFVQGERGSEAAIRERQRPYVELFKAAAPVVDLGFGRGEFLELMRDSGIACQGVDSNPQMVALADTKGLAAICSGALEHLRGLADSSLGGVFSAQSFEHWDRATVMEVTRLAWEKLRTGGVLVVETQNVGSVAVGASAFWTDITHVTPLHPEALLFLVKAVGFSRAEVRYLAPFGPAERPALASTAGLDGDVKRAVESINGAFLRLDKVLFGFRDYAIVATK